MRTSVLSHNFLLLLMLLLCTFLSVFALFSPSIMFNTHTKQWKQRTKRKKTRSLAHSTCALKMHKTRKDFVFSFIILVVVVVVAVWNFYSSSARIRFFFTYPPYILPFCLSSTLEYIFLHTHTKRMTRRKK